MGEDCKEPFWEFGKGVWQLLMDCFPDLDNTVDRLTTEGDTVTAYVAIFGTQTQDFLGITNKGLHFNSDHVFVFHFDEADRITGLTINWDHAGFCQQLGS